MFIHSEKFYVKFTNFFNISEESFLMEMQQSMQQTANQQIVDQFKTLVPDEWYDNLKIDFVNNRTGGVSLSFCGYLYVMERKYRNSINWICNKYSNKKLRCPARCLTSEGNRIKIGKSGHNHDIAVDVKIE